MTPLTPAPSQPGPHPSLYQPPHLSLPHPSLYQPPHLSLYQPPHSSLYQAPHLSLYQPPHSSLYQPPHLSLYQPPHLSLYQPPHLSLYQPPHLSLYQPPHLSLYQPPHLSLYQPPHSSLYQPPLPCTCLPSHTNVRHSSRILVVIINLVLFQLSHHVHCVHPLEGPHHLAGHCHHHRSHHHTVHLHPRILLTPMLLKQVTEFGHIKHLPSVLNPQCKRWRLVLLMPSGILKRHFWGSWMRSHCLVNLHGQQGLKQFLFNKLVMYWSAPHDFEPIWSRCIASIGHGCTRARIFT